MTSRRAARAEVSAPAACAGHDRTLFEWRSYRTAPGRRDDLIAMFEGAFLGAYEAGGARIVATFRDLDQPDRWIWIRAFRDAESRRAALEAFYSSAAWKAGRRAANATIADTREVFLLRAVSGGAHAQDRAALIVATIHPLAARCEEDFAALFAAQAAPVLRAHGGAPFATFITDRRPNSFPRQRVRTSPVFVTLTRFASVAAHDAFLAARDGDAVWIDEIRPALATCLSAPIRTHRLEPTARSALR